MSTVQLIKVPTSPRFSDERAAMKLVFATMFRAADRWGRVSITNLEPTSSDPPTADTDSCKTDRSRSVAA